MKKKILILLIFTFTHIYSNPDTLLPYFCGRLSISSIDFFCSRNLTCNQAYINYESYPYYSYQYIGMFNYNCIYRSESVFLLNLDSNKIVTSAKIYIATSNSLSPDSIFITKAYNNIPFSNTGGYTIITDSIKTKWFNMVDTAVNSTQILGSLYCSNCETYYTLNSNAIDYINNKKDTVKIGIMTRRDYRADFSGTPNVLQRITEFKLIITWEYYVPTIPKFDKPKHIINYHTP